ncbi:MAG: preprotein translocase subunit SecG [Verrucomicrobia bacterium]|nr:preprotein translocase subunit SecG [Verrucomicrobiota bacterium]MDA1086534.1 preprotein translocase subunit SecG [Verrucomicrobiota bacterium]
MADVLRYLLIFVEVFSSFLLIGAILIQKSKGQGLGMGFGQAMGETFLGAQAGNVLTKSTVTLAIVFFVNTMLLAYLYSDQIGGGSIMEDYSTLQPVPVPQTLPDPQFATPPEGDLLTAPPGSTPDFAPIAPPQTEILPIAPPQADVEAVEPPATVETVEPIQVAPVPDEDAAAPAPNAGE